MSLFSMLLVGYGNSFVILYVVHMFLHFYEILCIFFKAYGGMRGIKGMICETSVLDPNEVHIAWLHEL